MLLTEGEDAPPLEYVEGGAPVYYDSDPGVAYFPVFISLPGSCHCILPVRHVRGLWLDVAGRVVHRGHLPYRHPEPVHREAWQHSQGAVDGQVPLRGSLVRDGDRVRVLPPHDSIHERRREVVRPPERSWDRSGDRSGDRFWGRPTPPPRPAVIVEPARPIPPSVRFPQNPAPPPLASPPMPMRPVPDPAPARHEPRPDPRREREPARPEPLPPQARPDPRQEPPREERRARTDRVKCSEEDRKQRKCE